MNVRKSASAIVAVLLIAALGWTAWLAWATHRDLSTARSSVEEIKTAIESDDSVRRDAAIQQFKDSARSAHDRTDGTWWGMATYMPWVGDDAEGVQLLAASLDRLASESMDPLAAAADSLQELTEQGRVDVEVLTSMSGPLHRATAGVEDAAALVANVRTQGFLGILKAPFEQYAAQVDELLGGLNSATLATDLAPAMLGADGPRDYLLIFQNNAEIRATGGLPGSWARVHADNGLLTMEEQGSAIDFPVLDEPATTLTLEEVAVYGEELGRYWQDPVFTPDFPRSAEIFNAFWQISQPDRPLDGIISIDPVALSYLLEAVGPVLVEGVELTPANSAEVLLNGIYKMYTNPREQDRVFRSLARAIFESIQADVISPARFVAGLDRAAQERRLLVAPFRSAEKLAIFGTAVEGALGGDGGTAPNVFIGLNDATGSKMSYYLRYWADVESRDCENGVQTLDGTLKLNQTISPREARLLPDYITGGGVYGTKPGTQLVFVRIYAPHGGGITNIRIDGVRPTFDDISELEGRPVATIPISIENVDDAIITWTMASGTGQTGDGQLGITPSVVPGIQGGVITSTC